MKKLFRRLTAVFCILAFCLTSASALSVEQAVELLEANYVDQLPASAYEAATLDELFAAIGDPYTYYMNAADYEEFTAGVESETTVIGIGAGIEYTANGIRITSLLDGGGAKDVGLQIGDHIIAIDGISCVPAAETHRNLIIGEAGTYVTLTIRRPDGTTQDYRIERRTVTVHNTTVTFENGVGRIDCDSFGSQTSEYFSDGLEAYDTADVWVVDLRGNTGGLADAAVGALGAFTGFGPKLYYRLSDGSSFYTLYLSDAVTDKPAIVLVDSWSASASEILSGGIRAEDAGIVVGTRTYGKGTAQIVLDEDGYPDLFDGDSLKITAYRFYCSDGNTTDKIGVLPTLLVPEEHAADVAALLKATEPKSGEYLSFYLNGHTFYVDMSGAREKGDVLSALFSAFPPDILVNYAIGGEVVSCLDPADTAKRCGVTYADRRFTDLSDSPYPTPIDTLAVYGILGGDGKGHFFPDRTLTRAELAAMLAQALNVSSRISMGFSDMLDTAWYRGAVNAVASLGLMGGIGGGRFDPDSTLTQEQFITVMGRLVRFLNFRADDYALELTDEALADEAFAPFASWARTGASVLTQYDGNMLYTGLADIDAKSPVTREQAAATLCNILKTLDVLSY